MTGNQKTAVIIRHPQYDEVWNRIKRCHESIETTGRPQTLRVLGVSGVGKSTLLQHYKDAHPNVYGTYITEVPVVYAEVPAAPTSKQLVLSLLEGLGCEDLKGTAPQMWERFMTLAKSCKVGLLIIDEVQHFVDQGKLSTYSSAADLLKQKLTKLNKPVIFAGAPRSKLLFQGNNQLRTRYKASINFYPFRIRTSVEMQRFRGVIATMVNKFTDTEKRFLISDAVVERFFYATDGVYRNLVDLIDGILYLKNSGLEIDKPTLSQAYRETIHAAASGANDPFDAQFELRRLTEIDEPYYPSPMDGDNHAAY
jgi:energy-coupling factor transporter ATP-binding protein EcfA2